MKPPSQPDYYHEILKLTLELSSKRPSDAFTLAITGSDCAGKSAATKWLKQQLIKLGHSVATIEVDSYLRPRRLRTGRPTEAEDYYLRGFDFDQLLQDFEKLKQSLMSKQSSTIHQIIIVEGVFLLKAELRPNWDASFWLDISNKRILKRGTARDADYFGSREKARAVYETRIIPAQHIHHTRDLPLKTATSIYKSS